MEELRRLTRRDIPIMYYSKLASKMRTRLIN